jgi:hypothetical protein
VFVQIVGLSYCFTSFIKVHCPAVFCLLFCMFVSSTSHVSMSPQSWPDWKVCKQRSTGSKGFPNLKKVNFFFEKHWMGFQSLSFALTPDCLQLRHLKLSLLNPAVSFSNCNLVNLVSFRSRVSNCNLVMRMQQVNDISVV